MPANIKHTRQTDTNDHTYYNSVRQAFAVQAPGRFWVSKYRK
jgi:hypothetical protein